MQKPRSLEMGDRITAAEAAAGVPGLKLATLCRAIDAGTIRGERIEVGSRVIRVVAPSELAEDIANLPRCGHEGCDRPIFRPGGRACCGPHARALETKGTKLSAETCRRMSAGKKGKPRPDVRERVAAMHADPEQHYKWGVALAKGRKLPPQSRRRWGGRLGGLQADQTRGGRPRTYTDEQAELVLGLRNGLSIRAIARITGLSKRQVEAIVGSGSQAKVSRNPS